MACGREGHSSGRVSLTHTRGPPRYAAIASLRRRLQAYPSSPSVPVHTNTTLEGSGTTVVGVTAIETSPLVLEKLLTVVDPVPLMLKLKKVSATVSVVGMGVSPGGGGRFEIKL